jgi:hypothetical protein
MAENLKSVITVIGIDMSARVCRRSNVAYSATPLFFRLKRIRAPVHFCCSRFEFNGIVLEGVWPVHRAGSQAPSFICSFPGR